MPWLSLLMAATWLIGCGGEEARCGSGSWRPGALEIHHLALGQADATLIVSPHGQSLLVDVGEAHPGSADGARAVGAAVEDVLGCRRLDSVLITHFHLDHVGEPGIGGLWHLVAQQGFRVGSLFHRDLARFSGEASPTLAAWARDLSGGSGRFGQPRAVSAGATVDLGPAVRLEVVGADGQGALSPGDLGQRVAAPPSENDYSVALALRFGPLDYFLGGDLSGEHLVRRQVSYHDVETVVARGLSDMDVYRVNHHGSEHSSNATFLGQIDPGVAIVSAGAGNTHGHPHVATLERLQATSAVYLTNRGQSVLLRSTDGRHYTVSGDPYQAQDPERVDGDRDGYFREVDPDDGQPAVVPAPFGGCDPDCQPCR